MSIRFLPMIGLLATGMASCFIVRPGSPEEAASPQPVERDSFSSLHSQFAFPGKEYGSAPLWVWNTEVTTELIDTMMHAFSQNAFGGVFIHPRPGLVTEYLSDEWFRLVAHTLKKGRELGLQVWIYDENSYPSGFAGGHVPDQMPSSFNQGQMLHLTKADTLPADAEDYFIVLRRTGSGFRDITASLKAEQGKPGDFYLFSKENYRASPWYGGFSYVDLLMEGVTEKFIDLTMEGYERVAGDEFGKLVPGLFTDEPNIEVQGRGNIRWTPDLFKLFQQTWGYDLRNHLPSLYEETGDWKRVRHNYYQVLLQLFIDRWAKPWHAYTESKGLEWTGHYWEHGWPNPNHGGDNMAMYAWHQRPGIDMLFNRFNEESPQAQFGNIRAVKELASVANQLGKERTLSETYGGGGWELTFMDMKRLGDWEYVLGVNTLNQHLSFMTIQGARKYDYPQSFSYHSPWWPWYYPLNQYFARLSLALSMGEQINHVLVLEPTTSAWMYSAYENPHPRRQEIGEEFQRFVTFLEKKQAGFDLGSENIIKDHGAVVGDRFVIGQRAYSTVVIPPGMENVNRATFGLLQEFCRAGGTLLAFGQLQFLDGAASDKLADLQQQAIRFDLAAWDEVDNRPLKDLFGGYFASSKIEFLYVEGGNLYHQRREFTDGQLVFLVNSSMDEPTTGRVRIEGNVVLLLDAVTGNISRYPVVTEAGFARIDFELPPAGNQLLFISREKRTGFPDHMPQPSNLREVATGTTQVERLGPNVLTIDFCDIQLGTSLLRDLHVYHAADTVFKFHGFANGNPWNTSVQFKTNILDRDTFQTGTGFAATYHFQVDDGVDLNGLQAVVERPHVWKVSLNGKPLSPIPGQWWLDKSFAVFDLTGAVRAGNNQLTLVADPMRVHAEIEPVYILGDFGVKAAAKGFRITRSAPLELGSWRSQGMPFFGQQVAYAKSFTVREGSRYLIQPGKWKGTVAVVHVNGKEAGICFAPPFTLDISPYVREGTNQVQVVVVGSLKNTLGPFHKNPAPGLVSPWLFRNADSYPPGRQYQQLDYGMLEDFRIMSW